MPTQPVLETLRKFLEDRLIAGAQLEFSMPQSPVSPAETFQRMAAAAQQITAIGCGTMLPDDLTLAVYPPDARGFCRVVATRGEDSHEHLFRPLDQWQRKNIPRRSLEKSPLASAVR